jgi:hypothetical protein
MKLHSKNCKVCGTPIVASKFAADNGTNWYDLYCFSGFTVQRTVLVVCLGRHSGERCRCRIQPEV